MNNQKFITQIRDHIADNQLDTALRLLRDLLDNSPQLDEVIQQAGRYASIRKQIRLGTVSHADATLTENQIRKGLIDLLAEIEQQEVKPHLKEEMERAISIVNSKNVVSNSTITAGGNVTIGDNIDTQINIKKQVIYGEHKIPHVLTPPPFCSEVFIGRKGELNTIHDKLFYDNHLLLLVNGEGGIGKTTLASRYYHRYAQEYMHVAWVLSEKSIADALLQLAPVLGIRFDKRMDNSQRLPILFQAMSQLNKPCLLIIDNVNEPDDLQNNYQHLRTCSNFHVLLTTRITNFRQAETYKIIGLPLDDALLLFQKYYKNLSGEDTDIIGQIHEAVNSNTLVMELLAKNLHAVNRLSNRYTLKELLADLQQKGLLKISQTEQVDTDYGKLERATPEDIIAAMYDMSELSQQETALLSIFSVLPPENILFDTMETLITDISDLDSYLLLVYQKGWVDFNENNKTFKISPVIQAVVKKKQTDKLEEVVRELSAKLILKLDFEPDTGHLLNSTYAQGFIYSRYGEYIIEEFGVNIPALTFLCRSVSNFFQICGNLKKALHFSEKHSELGFLLYLLFPNNLHTEENVAISRSKLGEINFELGNPQKAIDCYKQEVVSYEKLVEKYPHNSRLKSELSVSYEKISIYFRNINMYAEAKFFGEKCLELIVKQLTDKSNHRLKKRLSNAYQNLGDIELNLENIDNALAYYLKCKALEAELILTDKDDISLFIGQSLTYERLGDVYLKKGLSKQSLSCLIEANRIIKTLCKSHPLNFMIKRNLSSSYSWLGTYYEQNKDKVNAKKFFVLSKRVLIDLRKKHPDYVRIEDSLKWILDAIERVK